MNYVQTFSGRKVVLSAPRASQIEITDIAHQLARLNRFVGATEMPISVAQHSVNVARILTLGKAGPLLQMKGLLHDAHEYVLGDIASPVKRAITELAGRNVLKILSDTVDLAIFARFAVLPFTADDRTAIKTADDSALAAEWRDQMKGPCPVPGKPAPFIIKSWPPDLAQEKFLSTFETLEAAITHQRNAARSSDLIK
jgi:hypothetical protein